MVDVKAVLALSVQSMVLVLFTELVRRRLRGCRTLAQVGMKRR